MVLLISVAFICLGIWLVQLNRKYVGVDPLFQSSFVCFTAAAMILGGALTAGGSFTLSDGLGIVFPIYLLLIYLVIVIGIPKYSYADACRIIEEETGEKILKLDGKQGYNGHYYCYTKKGYYTFDAMTGEYYMEYDPFIA